MNNLDKFRAKVASGRTCYGMVINSYDSQHAELAADAGMDFVWIDMEHSPTTITDAMHMVTATRGTDCAAFVRVPWGVNWVLKPVLDIAPAGVIVPMVRTAKDARDIVAACRYPTYGGERGFGVRRGVNWGAKDIDEYVSQSADDPMIIFQIEHREAVENLEAILAVPGWDSVCIGPFDLSASYGMTARFNSPEVSGALRTICDKTRAAGKVLGGFITPGFPLDRRLDWRCLATDDSLIFNGIRAAKAAAEAEVSFKNE